MIKFIKECCSGKVTIQRGSTMNTPVVHAVQQTLGNRLLQSAEHFYQIFRQRRSVQVAVLSVVAMLAFIGFFNFSLLILLAAFSLVAVLRYYKNKLIIPFEIAPIVFFSIWITNGMSLMYGVIFILGAIFISVVIGGEVDPSTPIYPVFLIALAAFSLYTVPLLGFIVAGVLVSVLEFFMNTGTNMFLGAGYEDVLPWTTIHLFMNVALFMTLGRIAAAAL
jgi:hypothetical protein